MLTSQLINFSAIITAAKITSKLVNVEFSFRNRFNYDLNHPAIVVANHQTLFDIFGKWHKITRRSFHWITSIGYGVMLSNYKKTVPMTKKELLYFGPWGFAHYCFRSVSINRRNSKEAKKTMEKTLEMLKKENVSFSLF